MKTSYFDVSTLLDTHIERVRNAETLSEIEIKDFSNRSGFEPSGYPYFLWSHRFSYNFHHGASLAMASVRIDYLEPMTPGAPKDINIRQMAEIFNRGQSSHYVEKSELKIPLADFLKLDLIPFVSAHLQESKQKILNQPEI